MAEVEMAGIGIQDVAAISVSLVAAAYVLRILIGTMNGSGCSTCSHKEDSKAAATPSPTLKRLPLVTLEQVGRPHVDKPAADSADPSLPEV